MFIDKIEQNRICPPRFLYKYYRNLNYAEDALKNERLHLDLPFDFNDVFDSARVVDYNELDFIRYDNCIDKIVKYTHENYKNQVYNILNSCSVELTYLSDVFEFLLKKTFHPKLLKA